MRRQSKYAARGSDEAMEQTRIGFEQLVCAPPQCAHHSAASSMAFALNPPACDSGRAVQAGVQRESDSPRGAGKPPAAAAGSWRRLPGEKWRRRRSQRPATRATPSHRLQKAPCAAPCARESQSTQGRGDTMEGVVAAGPACRPQGTASLLRPAPAAPRQGDGAEQGRQGRAG